MPGNNDQDHRQEGKPQGGTRPGGNRNPTDDPQPGRRNGMGQEGKPGQDRDQTGNDGEPGPDVGMLNLNGTLVDIRAGRIGSGQALAVFAVRQLLIELVESISHTTHRPSAQASSTFDTAQSMVGTRMKPSRRAMIHHPVNSADERGAAQPLVERGSSLPMVLLSRT